MKKIGKIAVISALCLLPVSAGLAYGQKAVYEKLDGANVGARVTFQYKDDSMFHVNTKPGFVTDIQLRDGETLTYVAGGDTKSWLIDKAMVGSVQHVYIKPLQPDKHTNIIINTDMHTYRFDVWSTMAEYDPLITFRFPEDVKLARQPKSSLIPDRHGMNREYEIKAKKKEKYAELIPTLIMDDGQRTYIRIPDTNRYDMPVLYMINPWDKKQTLINYRVHDGYFVADVVMEHGRLMFHQKYSVDFYNKAKAGSWKGSMRDRIAKIQNEDNEETHRDALAEMPKAIRPPREMNPVEEEVYEPPEGVKVKRPDMVEEVSEEDMFVPEAPPQQEAMQPAPVEEPYYEPVQVPQQEMQPVTETQPVDEPTGYAGMGEIPEMVAREADVAGKEGKVVAPPPVTFVEKTAAQNVQEQAPAQAQQAPARPVNRIVQVILDNGQAVRITEARFHALPTETQRMLLEQGRAKLVKG